MKSIRSGAESLRLDSHLPYLVNRAGNLVIQLFSHELARFKLTVPMWRVLTVLVEKAPQRLIDLAVLTSIEVSTLSRIVGAMHSRGLVVRTVAETSRREVEIAITAEGLKVFDEVIPVALGYEAEMIAEISPEDLETTKRTMRLVFRNLLAMSGRSEPRPAARRKAASSGEASRED